MGLLEPVELLRAERPRSRPLHRHRRLRHERDRLGLPRPRRRGQRQRPGRLRLPAGPGRPRRRHSGTPPSSSVTPGPWWPPRRSARTTPSWPRPGAAACGCCTAAWPWAADARPPQRRGRRHARQDDDHGDDLRRLAGAGLDPSYVIGGAFTGTKTGGHLGEGDVMVVEADESDGSFLQYPPRSPWSPTSTPTTWATGGPRRLRRRLPRFATAARARCCRLRRRPRRRELTERSACRSGTGRPGRHLREDADADVGISDPELAGTGSSFR